MSKTRASIGLILGAVIGLAPVAFCPPAQAGYVYVNIKTQAEVNAHLGKVATVIFPITNPSIDSITLNIPNAPSGCHVKYTHVIEIYKKGSISLTCMVSGSGEVYLRNPLIVAGL